MFLPQSSRYKDALEHTSTYNSRLVFERKQRSPFLDSQTGVAPVSCHLWKSKLVRRAPAYPYQLYSYPARRWKNRPKKVPTPAPSEPVEAEPATEEQIGECRKIMLKQSNCSGYLSIHFGFDLEHFYESFTIVQTLFLLCYFVVKIMFTMFHYVAIFFCLFFDCLHFVTSRRPYWT